MTTPTPTSTQPEPTQPETTQPETAQPETTTANNPRDEPPQYVLPLVVRMEREHPPQRTDALETAARAVLTFLSDPRVTEPDGEWAAVVEAWTDGRIRKVVRRARGGEWRRAELLAGITVTGTATAPTTVTTTASGTTAGTAASPAAEVRVYPPVPIDAWPKYLAKLQVSGTELEDAEPPAPLDADTAADLPVLWLSPELEMSAGKSMAQVGHAAQIAWWELDEAQRKEWAATGFRLAVRTASREKWPALCASGRPVVRDAGFTEIAPGSHTVVADLPVLNH